MAQIDNLHGAKGGRKKGAHNKINANTLNSIILAFETAAQADGLTSSEFIAKRIMKSDAVLIAFLKKVLPDLTEGKCMQEVVRTFLVRCSDDKKINNKIIFEKQTLASELPEYNK